MNCRHRGFLCALTYIKSDYYRYTGRNASFVQMIGYSFINRGFRFTLWFRLSSVRNFMNVFAKLVKRSMSSRYGISIPTGTKIGYGLYIAHCYGIIVNPSAEIGDNCNISQFTTIGSNDGPAAVIGDNVYMGPNVCLVENVCIGNNVTIGAGAVVSKDIPDNATCAGVPAKVLNYDAPARYIGNKWIES